MCRFSYLVDKRLWGTEVLQQIVKFACVSQTTPAVVDRKLYIEGDTLLCTAQEAGMPSFTVACNMCGWLDAFMHTDIMSVNYFESCQSALSVFMYCNVRHTGTQKTYLLGEVQQQKDLWAVVTGKGWRDHNECTQNAWCIGLLIINNKHVLKIQFSNGGCNIIWYDSAVPFSSTACFSFFGLIAFVLWNVHV